MDVLDGKLPKVSLVLPSLILLIRWFFVERIVINTRYSRSRATLIFPMLLKDLILDTVCYNKYFYCKHSYSFEKKRYIYHHYF